MKVWLPALSVITPPTLTDQSPLPLEMVLPLKNLLPEIISYRSTAYAAPVEPEKLGVVVLVMPSLLLRPLSELVASRMLGAVKVTVAVPVPALLLPATSVAFRPMVLEPLASDTPLAERLSDQSPLASACVV